MQDRVPILRVLLRAVEHHATSTVDGTRRSLPPVCIAMVFFRAGVLMRRLLETVDATMFSMLRVELALFPPSQLTWLRFANVTFHSPDVCF